MITAASPWPDWAPHFEWDWARGRLSCGCDGRYEGCDLLLLDERLLAILELARVWWGGPIAVTSGYRCPRYNAEVPGSAALSQHMFGRAVDFTVRHDPLLVYRMLDTPIVGGLALYLDGHIHLDVRDGPRWREIQT